MIDKNSNFVIRNWIYIKLETKLYYYKYNEISTRDNEAKELREKKREY